MKAKCATCAVEFVPHGWVASDSGAVVYAMVDGSVPLCSVKCETKWLEARKAKAA